METFVLELSSFFRWVVVSSAQVSVLICLILGVKAVLRGDGLVLSSMEADKSQAYGQTLVNLFKSFSGLQYAPGIAGILENKSELKRRITMIARFKKGSYGWSVLAVVLLVVLGCVLLTNAQSSSQAEDKGPGVLARELVDKLVGGDFLGAMANFDATMKAGLPANKLADVWKQTTGQAGIFNRQLGVRIEKYLQYDIALVTCEFEKGPLDVKVVYDEGRQVSGLYFLPTPPGVLEGYQNSEATAYIVTFMPKDGFSPETAKEILDKLNDCVKFKVKTSYFRTEIREGKLYGLIVTDSEADGEALESILSQCDGLEFVSRKQANKQELANHYAKGQPSLKASESRQTVKSQSPYVVSTFPVALSNDVDADVNEITVTFDQQMMDGSWSWTGGGETYPEKTGEIHYDSGMTTCTMPVKLEAGKVYWVGINSPSHKNFKTEKQEPAKRYVILFATKDESGKATEIPGDYIEKAKRINSFSEKQKSSKADESVKGAESTEGAEDDESVKGAKSAKGEKRTEDAVGRKVQLSNDDGSSDGQKSISGGGHGVIFESPGEGYVLRAVKIFGSRYGDPNPPKEDFHILVCDEKYNVLADIPMPYSRFKRGSAKWVTLRVEPIEVPSTFVICVGFNPEQTKGVYVNYDESASGNSLQGPLGKDMQVFTDGEWMIRAIVQQADGEGEGTEPNEATSEKEETSGKTDKMGSGSLAVEGWRLWGQRKLVEAEDKFQQAIDKDSKNENAYQGLGWAQLNQGKKINAQDSFEKCIAINPKNSAALNGLGWIEHGEGRVDEAIGWWEKAVDASDGQATASLSGLTQIYMEREDYQNAVKYYEMWLAVEPDNAGAQDGLEKAKAGI